MLKHKYEIFETIKSPYGHHERQTMISKDDVDLRGIT